MTRLAILVLALCLVAASCVRAADDVEAEIQKKSHYSGKSSHALKGFPANFPCADGADAVYFNENQTLSFENPLKVQGVVTWCGSSANPEPKATYQVGGQCAVRCDDTNDLRHVSLVLTDWNDGDGSAATYEETFSGTACAAVLTSGYAGPCRVRARVYCCIPAIDPNSHAYIASAGATTKRVSRPRPDDDN